MDGNGSTYAYFAARLRLAAGVRDGSIKPLARSVQCQIAAADCQARLLPESRQSLPANHLHTHRSGYADAAVGGFSISGIGRLTCIFGRSGAETCFGQRYSCINRTKGRYGKGIRIDLPSPDRSYTLVLGNINGDANTQRHIASSTLGRRGRRGAFLEGSNQLHIAGGHGEMVLSGVIGDNCLHACNSVFIFQNLQIPALRSGHAKQHVVALMRCIAAGCILIGNASARRNAVCLCKRRDGVWRLFKQIGRSADRQVTGGACRHDISIG